MAAKTFETSETISRPIQVQDRQSGLETWGSTHQFLTGPSPKGSPKGSEGGPKG